jgi:hypothetical protein
LSFEIGNLFFLERVLKLRGFMFRKKVQYVFEWTVPAKSWAEIRPEFNEFVGKAVRAAGIGVTIFCANFVVSKLILPDLQAPAAEKLLFVVGIIAACGALGTLAARCGSEKHKYGLSNEAVHTIPTEFLGAAAMMPFKICQTWVLHDSSNRMELFTRAGDIFIFDLPRDTALREQVVAFVQARVKPWQHTEAPSEMLGKTSTLDSRFIVPYWTVTLLGSLVMAYWISLLIPTSGGVTIELLFAQFFVGTGWFWAWSGWSKLRHFPFRKKFEVTFRLLLITNGLSSMLFVQFLAACVIRRITP